MIRKACALLTLLSLSCLHAELHSQVSADQSDSQEENLFPTYQKLFTQKLREVVHDCIDKEPPSVRSGFLISALSLYRKKVINLIKKGADPNVCFLIDSKGSCPQKNPSSSSVSLVQIAIERNDVDLLEFLLKWGASPNYLPGNFTSPLERAVRHGERKAVSLLLKYGASMDEKMLFGEILSEMHAGGGIPVGDGTFLKVRRLPGVYYRPPGLAVAMVKLLVLHGADITSNTFHFERVQNDLDIPRESRATQLLINYLKQAKKEALARQEAKKESCCNCNNSNNQ